ncbi:TPA: SLC13 family permease [Campylobacter jejuni]|nr:SLC13 family permease [Campylobacter jejuni]ECL6736062.1 SLC13 family permease [Campylobacter jejuni]ECP3050429.1 SLC13 family permease [Campylobacter jejuni]MCW1326206.1 SLC13 family permease [Campylobacter jejuni]MCW1327287.1 SLC13 family permease [Campylobacter jejuni]
MKIIVALSILILLILLIQNKIKPFILFGSLALLYYLLGYLNLNTWLDSYTNDSLIVLVLLLLVSVAIEKSVIINWCSKFIIGKNYHLSLLKLGIMTASISAFLNNTAVVASFMSVIKNNKFQAPSKLLIPLSYFCIVGGTMTLIGTSTNLMVNSFAVQNGLNSFKIFDFFAVGFCISVSVIIVILIFSFLLPEYKDEETKLDEYLISAKVLKNSSLIGKNLIENNLRNLEFLFLLEIQRQDEVISPVSHNEIIKENDVLIFSGDVTHLELLRKFDGLKIGTQEIKHNALNLVDVIISAESNLIGKSVKEVNFRTKFDAGIIALKRGSKNISKIGQSILQAGDRLILSVGNDFYSRDNISKNFYIISNIMQNKKLNNIQSFIVVFTFLAIIALSALKIVTLLKALFVFLVFLIVFKFVSFDELKRRFPLEIFIIVGSSLAITKVLVDSGLAKDFAQIIIETFGVYGVYGSFIGVYLLTLLLTEMITNNAAAALAFPIAYSSAIALEVNPTPFILAVAYGASCGFLMPHGYQTHLMVSSICSYKTTDFIKIGWIVSLVYSAIVLSLTPIIFKF